MLMTRLLIRKRRRRIVVLVVVVVLDKQDLEVIPKTLEIWLVLLEDILVVQEIMRTLITVLKKVMLNKAVNTMTGQDNTRLRLN